VSVNQLLNDLEQLIRVHPSLQDNEFGVTPLAEDAGRQGQRHRSHPDFAEPRRERLSMRAACRIASKSAAKCCATPLDLTKFKDGPNDRLLNVE
jgi:hypothetical protein